MSLLTAIKSRFFPAVTTTHTRALLHTGTTQRYVLIYNDTGANAGSSHSLHSQLQSLLSTTHKVQLVTSEFIRSQPWEESTDAFIVGGGSCTPILKTLGLEGIQRIRDYFFIRGGRVAGFCAGGYLFSEDSNFYTPGYGPLNKKHPFGFFKGTALGPISNDITVPQITRVAFKINNQMREGGLYSQGGCYFDIPKGLSNVEIIATYKNLGKVAAILCDRRGFFCGPHPEFRWMDEYGKIDSIREQIMPLQTEEPFRSSVMREVCRILNLPLK